MEISLPSSPIVMKGKRLLFDESPRPLIVEKSFDALIFSKLDIDPNQDFSFEEPSHEEKRVKKEKKEKKRVKKDKAEKRKKGKKSQRSEILVVLERDQLLLALDHTKRKVVITEFSARNVM